MFSTVRNKQNVLRRIALQKKGSEVSGARVKPIFGVSPFVSGVQKRTYTPSSDKQSWGSWIKTKIMGDPELEALKDKMFEDVQRFRNKIESGRMKFQDIDIYSINQYIKDRYETVANWEKDGLSINGEFFKVLGFAVIKAIDDSRQSGYFDSSNIRIALEICKEIGKLAPMQYYNDKKEIERIATLLFKYLVDRYKNNEELIPIVDLVEIFVLIDQISEKSGYGSVSFKISGRKFDTPDAFFMHILGLMGKDWSLTVIDCAHRKVEMRLELAKLLQQSVNNMFSIIRQQLIDEKDQLIVTRLQNLMSFNEEELKRVGHRLSDNMRKNRIFYFQEESPRERQERERQQQEKEQRQYEYTDQYWQQRQQRQQQREQEQSQQKKQQQQQAGQQQSQQTELPALIYDFFQLSSSTPDEIVLQRANQYIRANHPDKFKAGERQAQNKKLGAFMGRYDTQIKALKERVKMKKAQQQRNRE